MNITEKILAKAAGRDRVSPDENIWVNVDILMTHDVCGPPAIEIFKREFGEKTSVWNKEKLVIIPDHYIFTKNVHANRNVEILREFVAEQQLPHYYDVGTDRYKGVCHMALAEEGFNRPGSVLFGTDSHTCTSGAFGLFSTGVGNTDAAFIMGTGKLWVKVPHSMKFIFHGKMPHYLTAKDLILAVIGEIGVDGANYRAMEFAGEAISDLSIEERMTLTNMAIEAGGKNGIIAPDQKTFDYVNARTSAPYEAVYGDEDAQYYSVHEFDVSKLAPMVAKPHSPDNKAFVHEVEGTKLDQCYIGSCTGGKMEDFIMAAHILKGKEVVVPTYCVPATTHVANLMHETLVDGTPVWDILENAGCKLTHASCAACLGGPVDTFGRTHGTEVVISTTNRNFPGRMGSKQSSVYLASAYTVAASALAGTIQDVRNYL